LHKPNFGLKLLFLLTSIIAMAVPMTFGQAHRPFMKASPQAATQPAKPLTFDVVSVKRNESGEANSQMKMTPDGIQLMNVWPATVIREAYQLGYNQQLQNVPGWTISDRYDIEAKVDAGDVPSFRKLTFDQVREMLQPVLADRFRLLVHSQMKELPVYDLVVSKKGPKFAVAKPPSEKYPNGNLDSQSRYIKMEGLPMGSLAFALMRQLGRSVVDKTGLTEKYDLILKWSPDEPATPMSNGPVNTQQGIAQSPDSSEPSIFTAIQEQLGLRLVPSTGPVECVFIDHIERPSEN
jgi:uncharacterized protein (TIGR03435 family)